MTSILSYDINRLTLRYICILFTFAPAIVKSILNRIINKHLTPKNVKVSMFAKQPTGRYEREGI
jgi:hypothetical protein